MTATTTQSAYPRTVDELIPHARDLADQFGQIPSRNTLMKTFKIGGPKAKELIAALTPAPAAPTAPEPVEPEPVEPVAEPAVTPPALPPIDPTDETPGVGIVRPPTAPVESPAAEPVAEPAPKRRRPIVWPVLILCLPAFVAIWGGWVEMGRLTGFGMVTLLPGISDFQINTAITLPIGVETYAAYALYVWLSGMVAGAALRFAKWSALASLALGALGQVAYHLMAAAGWTSAPWPITAAVSCIPVAVLGMGAGLAHLMHRSH
ncbi:ABC transporter permease [Actinoplanes sp. ATCC 53533]|uniref:ABC transporter permease n=1 Tax=Actinoplanes sp. ATCC 53533 TaxID=1288362 RepID=UPI000F778359|nr:ABC transporter permease [Actinoplanes sp. ATCC 53533]RSM56601.1 ABC transporter permease [Actinoplanes sp. ATCC 53533]